MEMIVHKDPITGNLIYEYKEEPKKLTPEEQEKEDRFWHNIMESTKIHNEFMHRLTNAFWSSNIEEFNNTWNLVFKEYVSNTQLKNSEKDSKEVEQDFKSSFISSFINSIYIEENKKSLKENIYQLHEIWGSQLNGDLFILLTWQMDFKEQSLLLLENFSCDFNSDIYEYVQEKFIKDFRQRNLPLNVTEKNQILNDEKTNFLQIQKTYSTFKKLNDTLIPKNIKSKVGKI